MSNNNQPSPSLESDSDGRYDLSAQPYPAILAIDDPSSFASAAISPILQSNNKKSTFNPPKPLSNRDPRLTTPTFHTSASILNPPPMLPHPTPPALTLKNTSTPPSHFNPPLNPPSAVLSSHSSSSSSASSVLKSSNLHPSVQKNSKSGNYVPNNDDTASNSYPSRMHANISGTTSDDLYDKHEMTTQSPANIHDETSRVSGDSDRTNSALGFPASTNMSSGSHISSLISPGKPALSKHPQFTHQSEESSSHYDHHTNDLASPVSEKSADYPTPGLPVCSNPPKIDKTVLNFPPPLNPSHALPQEASSKVVPHSARHEPLSGTHNLASQTPLISGHSLDRNLLLKSSTNNEPAISPLTRHSPPSPPSFKKQFHVAHPEHELGHLKDGSHSQSVVSNLPAPKMTALSSGVNFSRDDSQDFSRSATDLGTPGPPQPPRFSAIPPVPSPIPHSSSFSSSPQEEILHGSSTIQNASGKSDLATFRHELPNALSFRPIMSAEGAEENLSPLLSHHREQPPPIEGLSSIPSYLSSRGPSLTPPTNVSTFISQSNLLPNPLKTSLNNFEQADSRAQSPSAFPKPSVTVTTRETGHSKKESQVQNTSADSSSTEDEETESPYPLSLKKPSTAEQLQVTNTATSSAQPLLEKLASLQVEDEKKFFPHHSSQHSGHDGHDEEDASGDHLATDSNPFQELNHHSPTTKLMTVPSDAGQELFPHGLSDTCRAYDNHSDLGSKTAPIQHSEDLDHQGASQVHLASGPNFSQLPHGHFTTPNRSLVASGAPKASINSPSSQSRREPYVSSTANEPLNAATFAFSGARFEPPHEAASPKTGTQGTLHHIVVAREPAGHSQPSIAPLQAAPRHLEEQISLSLNLSRPSELPVSGSGSPSSTSEDFHVGNPISDSTAAPKSSPGLHHQFLEFSSDHQADKVDLRRTHGSLPSPPLDRIALELCKHSSEKEASITPATLNQETAPTEKFKVAPQREDLPASISSDSYPSSRESSVGNSPSRNQGTIPNPFAAKLAKNHNTRSGSGQEDDLASEEQVGPRTAELNSEPRSRLSSPVGRRQMSFTTRPVSQVQISRGPTPSTEGSPSAPIGLPAPHRVAGQAIVRSLEHEESRLMEKLDDSISPERPESITTSSPPGSLGSRFPVTTFNAFRRDEPNLSSARRIQNEVIEPTESTDLSDPHYRPFSIVRTGLSDMSVQSPVTHDIHDDQATPGSKHPEAILPSSASVLDQHPSAMRDQYEKPDLWENNTAIRGISSHAEDPEDRRLADPASAGEILTQTPQEGNIPSIYHQSSPPVQLRDSREPSLLKRFEPAGPSLPNVPHKSANQLTPEDCSSEQGSDCSSPTSDHQPDVSGIRHDDLSSINIPSSFERRSTTLIRKGGNDSYQSHDFKTSLDPSQDSSKSRSEKRFEESPTLENVVGLNQQKLTISPPSKKQSPNSSSSQLSSPELGPPRSARDEESRFGFAKGLSPLSTTPGRFSESAPLDESIISSLESPQDSSHASAFHNTARSLNVQQAHENSLGKAPSVLLTKEDSKSLLTGGTSSDNDDNGDGGDGTDIDKKRVEWKGTATSEEKFPFGSPDSLKSLYKKLDREPSIDDDCLVTRAISADVQSPDSKNLLPSIGVTENVNCDDSFNVKASKVDTSRTLPQFNHNDSEDSLDSQHKHLSSNSVSPREEETLREHMMRKGKGVMLNEENERKHGEESDVAALSTKQPATSFFKTHRQPSISSSSTRSSIPVEAFFEKVHAGHFAPEVAASPFPMVKDQSRDVSEPAFGDKSSETNHLVSLKPVELDDSILQPGRHSVELYKPESETTRTPEDGDSIFPSEDITPLDLDEIEVTSVQNTRSNNQIHQLESQLHGAIMHSTTPPFVQPLSTSRVGGLEGSLIKGASENAILFKTKPLMLPDDPADPDVIPSASPASRARREDTKPGPVFQPTSESPPSLPHSWLKPELINVHTTHKSGFSSDGLCDSNEASYEQRDSPLSEEGDDGSASEIGFYASPTEPRRPERRIFELPSETSPHATPHAAPIKPIHEIGRSAKADVSNSTKGETSSVATVDALKFDSKPPRSKARLDMIEKIMSASDKLSTTPKKELFTTKPTQSIALATPDFEDADKIAGKELVVGARGLASTEDALPTAKAQPDESDLAAISFPHPTSSSSLKDMELEVAELQVSKSGTPPPGAMVTKKSEPVHDTKSNADVLEKHADNGVPDEAQSSAAPTMGHIRPESGTLSNPTPVEVSGDIMAEAEASALVSQDLKTFGTKEDFPNPSCTQTRQLIFEH